MVEIRIKRWFDNNGTGTQAKSIRFINRKQHVNIFISKFKAKTRVRCR